MAAGAQSVAKQPTCVVPPPPHSSHTPQSAGNRRGGSLHTDIATGHLTSTIMAHWDRWCTHCRQYFWWVLISNMHCCRDYKFTPHVCISNSCQHHKLPLNKRTEKASHLYHADFPSWFWKQTLIDRNGDEKYDEQFAKSWSLHDGDDEEKWDGNFQIAKMFCNASQLVAWMKGLCWWCGWW